MKELRSSEMLSASEHPLIKEMRRGVQQQQKVDAVFDYVESIHTSLVSVAKSSADDPAQLFADLELHNPNMTADECMTIGGLIAKIPQEDSPLPYSLKVLAQAGYTALLLASREAVFDQQDKSWKQSDLIQGLIGKKVNISRPMEYMHSFARKDESELWLLRTPFCEMHFGNGRSMQHIGYNYESAGLTGNLIYVSSRNDGKLILEDEVEGRRWRAYVQEIFDTRQEPLKGAYSLAMPRVEIREIIDEELRPPDQGVTRSTVNT